MFHSSLLIVAFLIAHQSSYLKCHFYTLKPTLQAFLELVFFFLGKIEMKPVHKVKTKIKK